MSSLTPAMAEAVTIARDCPDSLPFLPDEDYTLTPMAESDSAGHGEHNDLFNDSQIASGRRLFSSSLNDDPMQCASCIAPGDEPTVPAFLNDQLPPTFMVSDSEEERSCISHKNDETEKLIEQKNNCLLSAAARPEFPVRKAPRLDIAPRPSVDNTARHVSNEITAMTGAGKESSSHGAHVEVRRKAPNVNIDIDVGMARTALVYGCRQKKSVYGCIFVSGTWHLVTCDTYFYKPQNMFLGEKIDNVL